MRNLICLAFALAVDLGVASHAAAHELTHDGIDAHLSWQLGFGGEQPLQTGYGLTVGYRGQGPGAAAGQLLQLDVTNAGALATLVGLPVLSRHYRVSQSDLPTESTDAAGAKPWYARQWVWWTAGGLAATVALTGGGTIEYNGNNNNNNNSNTGRGSDGCPIVSGEVADEETPCAADTVGTQCVEGEVCVFCGNNGVTDGCEEWTGRRVGAGVTVDLGRERWLDAGTGRMGDLIAR